MVYTINNLLNTLEGTLLLFIVYVFIRFLIPTVVEKFNLNFIKILFIPFNFFISSYIYPELLDLSDLGYMLGNMYYLIYLLVGISIIAPLLYVISYLQNNNKLFRYALCIFLLPFLYLILEVFFKRIPFITGVVIEVYTLACVIRFLHKFEFRN